MFLGAFNIYYLLPFLFAAEKATYVLGSYKYYYGTYILTLLTALGSGALASRGRVGGRRLRSWQIAYACALVFMIGNALFRGENPDNIFTYGLIYFTISAVSSLGSERGSWRMLTRILEIHALFGCLFVVWHFFVEGIVSRNLIYLTSGFNVLLTALYPGTFLFVTLPGQSWFRKATGIVTFILQTLQGYFQWLKFTSVLWPIHVLFLGLVQWRRKRPTTLPSRPIWVGAFLGGISLMVVVWIAATEISDGHKSSDSALLDPIVRGVEGTNKRWQEGGTALETTSDDLRWLEVRWVVSKMEWYEWLTGCGMGATWLSPNLYRGVERPMIHFSYMDFVFRGGVGFLILMLVPLWNAFIVLKRSRDTLSLGCAATVIIGYITMASYNISNMTSGWILFALCIGHIMTENPPGTLKRLS
jgi:hypothetical protein